MQRTPGAWVAPLLIHLTGWLWQLIHEFDT
jgi:hypothetical protein